MRFCITVFCLCFFISLSVQALEIYPDAPRIINLPEDASSVIIGNPSHAYVVLDNPRLMIVTAGLPGVTQLTVLGKDGHIIWNDRLIVNVGGGNYIRINNACINGGDECQSTKMLYCGDGSKCHSVAINTTNNDNGSGGVSSDVEERDE